jgi:hypothetical protein
LGNEKRKFAEDGKTPLKLVRKRLEWVKKQIMATPERYNQASWHYDEDSTCKTVGCIAGWLDVKMRGFRLHQQSADELGTVRQSGTKALGLLREPKLFDGSLCSLYPTGSVEAAEYACQQIDQYMASVGA